VAAPLTALCRLICTEDKDYFKTMLSTLMSNYGLNDAGSHEDIFVNRWVVWM